MLCNLRVTLPYFILLYPMLPHVMSRGFKVLCHVITRMLCYYYLAYYDVVSIMMYDFIYLVLLFIFMSGIRM